MQAPRTGGLAQSPRRDDIRQMDAHDSGSVVSAAAQVYEDFFVPALFGRWPPVVLDAAEVSVGDHVLDVGTGTGVLARAAAERVGPTGRVVGVDVNEGMLAVARGLDARVEWRTGSAEDVPLPPDDVDVALSQFMLMFVPDPAVALTEMARVVRPGGRVAVATWAPLSQTPGYAAMHQLLHDVLGPEAARSLEVPYSLGDATDVAALVEDSFDDVTARQVAGTAHFDSVEAWVHTDIRGWTLAGSIDDEQYASVLTAARDRLAEFVLPGGGVEFPHPAVIATGRA